MRHRKDFSVRAGRRSVGIYAAALVAVGLGLSISGKVWGADEGQAVSPVDVNGGTATAPEALVPGKVVAKPIVVQKPVVETPTVTAPVAPAAPVVNVPAVTVEPPVATTPAAPVVTVPSASISTEPAAPVVTVPSASITTAPAAPVVETPATPVNPNGSAVTPPSPVAMPPGPPVVTPAQPAPTIVEQQPTTPTTPPTTPTPVTSTETAVPTTSATIAPPTTSVAATTAAVARDNKTYPLSSIKVNYYKPNAQQPPMDQLLSTPVTLGVVDGAYVAPRAGSKVVSVKLGDIGKAGVTSISRSGIEQVYGQMVRFYNSKGIIGVFVVVDAKDIDAADNDIRPAERKTLQFIVVTSMVKEVRTVETGDVAKDGERVDNPADARVRNNSPLKGGSRMDLLNKNVLDNYVLRLNRHPGRRVDVAISGAGDLGSVDLDYLVSQSRPWYVYAQASNTGTKETNPWRERFGFTTNQLTGHDDILSLDYITAGFHASEGVVGSYDTPVLDWDRLRNRVYGSWNEFTASDVGRAKELFTGDEWTIGDELSLNIFQQRELFVDAVAGVRLQGITTDNHTRFTNGVGNFVEPYMGLRFDRSTELSSTTGAITLTAYSTDDSSASLANLGRTAVDKNPWVLSWEFSHSFFLEPILDQANFIAGRSTLAHEIVLSTRGQNALGYRLFPQAQQVAGGFYSVRGYPESVTAGDTVYLATAEYRLHIPRLFPIENDPTRTPFLWDKSFRASPQQPYGRPDWDLIARAFFDVGQVINEDPQIGEHDYTLASTGLGLELQYKQNLNIRVDWGVALQEIPTSTDGSQQGVAQGSNRFHITATLLY